MTYLDHAATTPMLSEVVAAMAGVMGGVGNPSSLHGSGRRARRVVEESRERLAEAIDARPSEVIFTSGGTEADNLAIKGIFFARQADDPRRVRILVGATEHHAVIDSALWLATHAAADIEWLAVDAFGVLHPETLTAAIGDDPESVALVSVMWANNEVGTIAPIAQLAGVTRRHGIPFHTDAVQAFGVLDVSFAASGVDALSITGHKLGGPVGTGALILRRDVGCMPLLHGGGQERDVRSGTVDTAGVLGLSLAAEIAVGRREVLSDRLRTLRQELIAGVRDRVEGGVLNGHPIDRLPGNAHLSFEDCEGDSLLMLLDARGIECSTGSACSAGVAQASHVLTAMGAPDSRARGSLRFSLGHTSTSADVDALLAEIEPVVQRARRAGMASATTEHRVREDPAEDGHDLIAHDLTADDRGEPARPTMAQSRLSHLAKS